MVRKRIFSIRSTIDLIFYFSLSILNANQQFWNENQPDKMQIRFYLTKNTRRRQSVIFDDISEDEYMMSSPRELFGQHTDFVMSRMYVDNPNWDFLFYYWTTLYDRWVKVLLKSAKPIWLFKEFSWFIQITSKKFPMKILIPLRKPITVYSCGSKMLNKDVKKACCDYNKKGFNFRYIHEAFNWFNLMREIVSIWFCLFLSRSIYEITMSVWNWGWLNPFLLLLTWFFPRRDWKSKRKNIFLEIV